MTPAPRSLLVQLKKGRDSRPTLICVRPDGTRSWSRLHPFFPIHDLTHYAVESVFGFREAFFGLVALGWNIDSFTEPGAATRLPAEALVAEHMVGLLDLERGSGQLTPAADFNQALGDSLGRSGGARFRPVTDQELGAVRKLRSALQARWSALEPGETLELEFPAGQTVPAASD